MIYYLIDGGFAMMIFGGFYLFVYALFPEFVGTAGVYRFCIVLGSLVSGISLLVYPAYMQYSWIAVIALALVGLIVASPEIKKALWS